MVLSSQPFAALPRFSVVQPKGASARNAPMLVVLSADSVDGLALVVVAPVMRLKDHGPITRGLHVPVQVNGEARVVVTEELVSIPKTALGKPIALLDAHRSALVAALDFLFQGY